jgi:hypothetical protein
MDRTFVLNIELLNNAIVLNAKTTINTQVSIQETRSLNRLAPPNGVSLFLKEADKEKTVKNLSGLRPMIHYLW